MARILRNFTTLGFGLILWTLCTEALRKPSGIKLENNEYTGIVVAIHPDEPENTQLIDIIKEMFRNGSSYLYQATKQRAFFKEVTILIPQNWSDHPSYTPPGNATFSGADVIIAAFNPRFAPDGETSATPYTKHLEGCGKQGLYIHMTSPFLENYRELQDPYGDYGRVLVHEWGHYRWGLFNEYPDIVTDREQARYFYVSETTDLWEPVSCPRGWQLSNIKYNSYTGGYSVCNGDEQVGYENGCVTQPDKYQPNVTGSIMHSFLTFPQIVNFCDNETDGDLSYLHNSDAPTQHNKMCDERSNWEVMREHTDFRDNRNPPRVVDDVTPTFHVVRSRPGRVVLVLDTSGSMSRNNRHLRLAAAARTYILLIATLGTSVGIVDFDSNAHVISNLTELVSEEVREDLANQVPVDASGGTCIGCGMQEALSVLRESNGNVTGGKILLITDGQDGEADFTEMIKMEYIMNKVIIDSIAVSDNAEPKIIDLADSTGGQFFLQTDTSQSTGILDALGSSDNTGGNDQRIEVSLDVKTFAVGETEYRKSVYIDSTLGKLTTFDFTYISSSAEDALDVIVTSPTGEIYDQSSTSYRKYQAFKKITITINGTSEPGSWDYLLQNLLTSETYDVTASVSSYPSNEDVDPILVSSCLISENGVLKLYAEVRQGYSPVINAEVTAVVESSSGTSSEKQLFDNGAGADITKEDGIYSRYHPVAAGGFYGLKIKVVNKGNAVILKSSPKGSRVNAHFDPEKLLAGNLTEFANLNISLPGAPIRDLEGIPAPNFTRGISGGATRTETPIGWSPTVDTLPPNKINDFEVTRTSHNNGTVEVVFTAPGDDLDSGNANHYVIQWCRFSSQLRHNRTFCPRINQTDVINGNLSSPEPFGITEKIIFRIPLPSDVDTVSFKIAVYAVDDAGNEAPISNIEDATFRRYIPPPIEEIITTEQILETTSILTSTSAHTNLATDQGFKTVLTIVFLCVISIVILGIVIIILARKFPKGVTKNSTEAQPA